MSGRALTECWKSGVGRFDGWYVGSRAVCGRFGWSDGFSIIKLLNIVHLEDE